MFLKAYYCVLNTIQQIIKNYLENTLFIYSVHKIKCPYSTLLQILYWSHNASYGTTTSIDLQISCNWLNVCAAVVSQGTPMLSTSNVLSNFMYTLLVSEWNAEVVYIYMYVKK